MHIWCTSRAQLGVDGGPRAVCLVGEQVGSGHRYPPAERSDDQVVLYQWLTNEDGEAGHDGEEEGG